MPIVCKALEIESDGGGWRGVVSPGLYLFWRGDNVYAPIQTPRSISFQNDRRGFDFFYLRPRNVHHSNEPHDPGNTAEGRVDTEVQKLCRAPLIHLLRGPQLAIAKPRMRSSNNRARRGHEERKIHLGISSPTRRFRAGQDKQKLADPEDRAGSSRIVVAGRHHATYKTPDTHLSHSPENWFLWRQTRQRPCIPSHLDSYTTHYTNDNEPSRE